MTCSMIAKAVRLGIGVAILALAAVALTGGSAEAFGPSVTCSASGTGGRQMAMVVVSDRDPGVCIRIKLGSLAPQGTPDCWTAVRINGLSCLDASGNPNIIDL
jgi:hypothetical protein